MAHSDYPEAATNAAKKARKHKEEKGSDCGTSVGWTRARQLANREALSDDEVIRTYSFLSRARVYYKPGSETPGTQAYLLWGGPAGLVWARSILNQLEKS